MLEAEGIAAARITVTDISNMDLLILAIAKSADFNESNFRTEVNINL